MSDRGWCSFARQHRGFGREGPFGYPAGARNQNRPVLFVDHIMGGYKRTLDSDPWRFANWVGVTFGIGRDGSLDQYCSIFDAHWGNGIAGSVPKYDRANPRLAALERLGTWTPRPTYSATAASLDAGGVNVINAGSIASEHEDAEFSTDDPWPEAMVQTSIASKLWALEELEREGMPMTRDEFMLAGHFQIDAVNRPGCPGKGHAAVKSRMLAALMGKGNDMFVRYPPTLGDTGFADWFSQRLLKAAASDYIMQLAADFPSIPSSAKSIELEVQIDPTLPGTLIWKDGDGRYAARMTSPVQVVRIIPRDRTARFFVLGGDVKVVAVRALGYWQ